jgi:hypothetical protein
MAYSRFAKNPFGFFGKYEAVVKEEEVKEEAKVERRMVEYSDLTPEEQERAIQHFLEIPQPLYGGQPVRKRLMLKGIVIIPGNTKEGDSTTLFLIDSQRYIHMRDVLPYMLKRLGIKESYSFGGIQQKFQWHYMFSPVIAPAP